MITILYKAGAVKKRNSLPSLVYDTSIPLVNETMQMFFCDYDIYKHDNWQMFANKWEQEDRDRE